MQRTRVSGKDGLRPLSPGLLDRAPGQLGELTDVVGHLLLLISAPPSESNRDDSSHGGDRNQVQRGRKDDSKRDSDDSGDNGCQDKR